MGRRLLHNYFFPIIYYTIASKGSAVGARRKAPHAVDLGAEVCAATRKAVEMGIYITVRSLPTSYSCGVDHGAEPSDELYIAAE